MPRSVMTDPLEPWAGTWEHDGSTWHVSLRWAEVDGFVECVGVELTCGDDLRALSAAVVRALPFGGLLRDARSARYDQTWGPVIEALTGTDEEAMVPTGVDREARRWAERPVIRGLQLDDDHYDRVARIYSRAANRGVAPRKAVAETMQVSPPTASRWISEARRRALLPPTTPGKVRATTPATEDGR